MNALPFSFVRAGLIAGHVLRAASRQRAAAILVLLAAAFVVGSLGLRDVNFGASELKFLADLGFGAMTLFGSALAIVATAQLFFAEIEQRTLLTLLAKPVRRAEFVVGQYLGVVALLAGFCALLTGLLAAMLWSRAFVLASGPDAVVYQVNHHAIAAVGLTLWLELAVLAALTLLIASFAETPLFAIALGFLVLAVCHLQSLAQDAAQRAGTLAARVGAGALALLLPNFQVFNFAESLGAGVPLAWGDVASVGVYALGYAATVCALAVVSFNRREL